MLRASSFGDVSDERVVERHEDILLWAVRGVAQGVRDELVKVRGDGELTDNKLKQLI